MYPQLGGSADDCDHKLWSLFAGSAGAKNTEEVIQTVSTLKTNVIGLGNYINSVNR